LHLNQLVPRISRRELWRCHIGTTHRIRHVELHSRQLCECWRGKVCQSEHACQEHNAHRHPPAAAQSVHLARLLKNNARLAPSLAGNRGWPVNWADVPHSIIESKLQKHRSALSYEVKVCPVRWRICQSPNSGTPFASAWAVLSQ